MHRAMSEFKSKPEDNMLALSSSQFGPNSDVGQLMIRRAAMGSGAASLDGGETLHSL